MIYCINRSKFTKNSKGNSPVLKNIKIILLINIITLAFDANIKAASERMTLINSQPTTLAESASSADQRTTQGLNNEFFMLLEQAENQMKTAGAEISKILGTEYPIPKAPRQDATLDLLKVFDKFFVFERTENKLIRLIYRGVFFNHYSKTQRIAHSAIAIKRFTNNLESTLSLRETQFSTLLKQDRKQIIALGEKFLLLLQVMNTRDYPGYWRGYPAEIDLNDLETSFKEIEKIREKQKELKKIFVAEQDALDNYLKAIQEQLSKAHPIESESLPISPRQTPEAFIKIWPKGE